MPSFALLYRSVSDVSLLVRFSETQVVDSDKVTTSAIGTVEEATQPEPEIPMTTTEGITTSVVGIGGESSQLKGLQLSEEVDDADVKETSSSIDDMIKKLSQAGGSEVPMIEARGVSTSAKDVEKGPSQPKDSHKKSYFLHFNQVKYNKNLIHNSGSSSCC